VSKLHELLAVEGPLSDQADARRKELRETFEKKRNHFAKKEVTFKSSAEGVPETKEEQLGMQTTVPKELKWISGHIARAIDAAYQIDVANMSAKADVVLDDGTTLLKDIPATQLLQLQKRVQEIKDLVVNAPTLDPSKGFQPDAQEGHGVFKAREEVKVRTSKKKVRHVLFEPTDKQPGQAQLFDEDVPTGHIHTQEWSGLLTVTAKADMLDRVEELTRAVKKARARANEMDIDVKGHKIAQKLLDHVFGPVIAA